MMTGDDVGQGDVDETTRSTVDGLKSDDDKTRQQTTVDVLTMKVVEVNVNVRQVRSMTMMGRRGNGLIGLIVSMSE